MGHSRGAGDARGDDSGGCGAGAAVFLGAVWLRRVPSVCGNSHAVRQEGKSSPGTKRYLSLRDETSAGDARLPGRAFLCAEPRKALCHSAVHCAASDRNNRRYPGHRFYPGDLRHHAGCVHRIYLERLRGPGIASDVFPIGGSAESLAFFDGRAVVCVVVYRGEDACSPLGGHPRARFAHRCRRNSAAGVSGFPSFSRQATYSSAFFKHDFVDVAPKPTLAGFYGLHDGVLGSTKVLGGVLVFRGVAAADVPAALTQTQVHPTVAHLETLFASLGFRLYGTDLIGVGAVVGHSSLLVALLRGLNRDAYRKARVARHGVHGNLAVHFGDDAIDKVQAEASAFTDTLGGEKRIEDARFDIGGNARTVVGNFDQDEIVFASGANAQVAAVAHGIGGVVDQVSPHLVELAAISHDFGQIRSVVAHDANAALEFVMHDGQRGFQALGDVYLLQLGLVHVGIFFDGFDEVGDARGAVLEFVSNALHFEQRGEARQLRAQRRARYGCEAFQLSVGEVCFHEQRRQLPGVGNVPAFQPALNRFFALDAREFVLERSGLQRRANFLLALRQHRAILGADSGRAPHLAQTLEAIAQRARGTPRRRGRIVQLVRQTCGQFAEGREFFALLAGQCVASYAVGQHADQALRQKRHAMEHLREVLG